MFLQLGHCLLACVLEGSILASRSGLRDHHSLGDATHTIQPCLPSLIFYKIPTAGNPAFTTLLSYKLSLYREGRGGDEGKRGRERGWGERPLGYLVRSIKDFCAQCPVQPGCQVCFPFPRLQSQPLLPPPGMCDAGHYRSQSKGLPGALAAGMCDLRVRGQVRTCTPVNQP